MDILVTEAVLNALDRSGLNKPLQGDAGCQNVKPLLQQYQRLQRRKRDMVEDYATGRLTRAELAHAKVAIERQIEQVQAQLQPQRALELVPAGQTIREAWENGSLAWRRMVLALLIERVVIKPALPTYRQYHGYRFSAESVAINWK